MKWQGSNFFEKNAISLVMIFSLQSVTAGFILSSTQLGSLRQPVPAPIDSFELVGVEPRLGLSPSGQTVVSGVVPIFAAKSPVSEKTLGRLLKENDFNRRAVARKLSVSSQAISWRIHHCKKGSPLAAAQDHISKQGRFSHVSEKEFWELLEKFWGRREMVAEVTGLKGSTIRSRIHRANLTDDSDWDGRKGEKTVKEKRTNCLKRSR